MKICAIICEYNPLHSGHAYQINEAKIKTNAGAVLCMMSGNFVQRAQPACVDKYLRATAALKNGADFVFELPTIFAAANAQKFAEGAISLLKQFDNVKYLSFGCENADENLLNIIAKVQIEENKTFKDALNQKLKLGISYPAALSAATETAIKAPKYSIEDITNALSKPNNLLAIEYIKAIKRSNCDIQPIFIERKGNGYNSESDSGEHISATAARLLMDNQNFSALQNYIPQNCFDELINEIKTHFVDTALFDALIINALRNQPLEYLYDVSEGIENKLSHNALIYTSLTQILDNTKSKRYTMARLKRIALQALLGITKELMTDTSAATTRLLGAKNNCRQYFSSFPSCAIIQNTQINELTGLAKNIAEIDKRASNIYSLLTRKNGNQYYENKIILI